MAKHKRSLRGLAVVITGASAGIGAELARQLAAGGAKLVLAARRLDKLEALNTELGGGHLCVSCDVSVTADCEGLIARAYETLGRIDLLICNAGYGAYEPVAHTSPQRVREMFATNVFGTTDCIHAAVPRMRAQDKRDGFRGQIMLMSSAAARRGVPWLGVYSATKAAQLSIAEALRVELADDAIAVTSIHPIMTRTEFGDVAEQRGGAKLPQPNRDRWTQDVDRAVGRMVAGVRRPRPEVWPSRPSRWLLGLGTLIPGLVDRGMRKFERQIADANRPTPRP